MKALAKPLWIVFGLLMVGLAGLGMALPLLPTTPFLLVAAFAFARSSPRLHRWLIEHKQFGPFIRNWQDHGAIGRRTKYISVGVMVCLPVLSYFMGAPLWTIIVQIVVLSCSALFILTRPDAPSDTPTKTRPSHSEE